MSEQESGEAQILTVIARRRQDLRHPSDVWLDHYPKDVKTRLQRDGHKNVQHAATIAELSKRINDFAANNRRFGLQLVAHGDPGYVALEGAWTKKYKDGAEYCALDSNPTLLANLMQYKGTLTEVILAACNVGNPTALNRAVGGTPLLFTLEELWDCPVWGATGATDGNMFESGRFTGTKRRWCDPPIEPIPAQQAGSTSERASEQREEITFESLTALRLPTDPDLMRCNAPIPIEVSEKIGRTYHAPRADVGTGSTAAEFTISLAGPKGAKVRGTASLIFDCQCLLVCTDTQSPSLRDLGGMYYRCYDATEQSAIKGVLSHLRELATSK